MGDPIYHDERETWKEEFKRRPGQRIRLRDGTELKPGERFGDPAYYVTEGKSRDEATASWFMLPGIDGIERTYLADADPDVVIVEDRHGTKAAYHWRRRLAADDSGADGKTAAQMGAVIAGERVKVERQNDPDRYAAQFACAYDAAVSDPTSTPKLVRATDAFTVHAKRDDVYPGFCAAELLPLLGTRAGPGERERLTAAVLDGGPALVAELLASFKLAGREPEEDHARSLIERVRAFGADVAAYERLVGEDLARARADLDLARRALTRLLVGGDERGAG